MRQDHKTKRNHPKTEHWQKAKNPTKDQRNAQDDTTGPGTWKKTLKPFSVFIG